MERKKIVTKHKKRPMPLKKRHILIISLVVMLIFGLSVSGYTLVRFSGIDFVPKGDDKNPPQSGDFIEQDDYSDMSDITDAKDLNDLLKRWAKNDGDILKSRKVVNVLLIGLDSREQEARKSSNSDVIMLVSLNKDTKKITLCSFYRDSYTYIESPNGDRFSKINSAYANGGARCLIDTIQNDYKIFIDYYFAVDFESFEGLVNEVGGVFVDVQQYEANYINSQGPYNMTWGEGVKLNGEQALMFARIRHSDVDNDISRTRRQRGLITALIEQSSAAGIGQLDNIIRTLAKYVETDCAPTELISLGTQAILGKWYNYDVVELQMPDEDTRMEYSGSAWIWVVDYPLAAQTLQNALYGTTNIVLEDNRKTAIDIVKDTIVARLYAQQATSTTEVEETDEYETGEYETGEYETGEYETGEYETREDQTNDVNEQTTTPLTTLEQTTQD